MITRGVLPASLAMLLMVCSTTASAQATDSARLRVPSESDSGRDLDAPLTPEETAIAWAGQVAHFIKTKWRVPAAPQATPGASLAQAAPLVARVRLQFDANGTMTGYSLSRSSQDAAYDNAVLNAVATAGPRHIFGPPPTNASFTFSIDFNSQEQPQ